MLLWISIILAFVSAVCVGIAAVFSHKQRLTVDPGKPGFVNFHADEKGKVSWVTVWTLGAAGSAAISAGCSAAAQLIGA
ncbi:MULTISPECIES: hypothetical protein [unclassified Microbacterium]|uniref:hypothetical protein n=1 Tax=unclassified Microbacterium TaxID=2609290 RepID=UPI00109B7EE3|nr:MULTISPECIES: hypothetical protein [unclassified Microbacterium]